MRHYRSGMAKLAERFLRKTHNQTLRTFAPTKEVIQQLNNMGVHNTRLLSRGVDTKYLTLKKRCCRAILGRSIMKIASRYLLVE